MRGPINRRGGWFTVLAVLGLAADASADVILLEDEFNGPALDPQWNLATWFIGDRTQFGNQPTFGSDADGTTFITLPLDTYNPNLPGERVFGTEIWSAEAFDNGAGPIEFRTRARLRVHAPGLVAAFFTYNERRRRGRTLSDEIDYEVLSKQPLDRVLATSWNDWGAPGSNYDDGVHHLGGFHDLPGFDWRQWNVYRFRWYADRVEWWVNGELIRVNTSPVPDLAQPIRASLWAGGTTWPDAYDPSLQPTAEAALNQRYEWDLDFIEVVRLDGGGGGGGGQLDAPTDVSASADGNTVSLLWTDRSAGELGFNIYRAWKPKGKSQPDFNPVGSTGPDSTTYSETVQDGDFLYRVRAFDAVGESADSNTAEVRVGSGGKGGGRPNR